MIECATVLFLGGQYERQAIVRDGKELSCANGDDKYNELEAGTHRNIALQFCMPTREKFIEIQEWEDDTFNEASFHFAVSKCATVSI